MKLHETRTYSLRKEIIVILVVILLICLLNLNIARSSLAGILSSKEDFVHIAISSKGDFVDVDPRPRNLHLALLGDSVTRYQYISLAYFLKTGKWVPTNEKPSLLNQKDFTSWNHYLEYTNTVLQPQEQCDCFRADGGRGYGSICENRYFSDPTRNNYITFITKFGKAGVHGHWPAPDMTRTLQNGTLNMSAGLVPYTWDNYNWSEVIVEHIAKLQPKPTFLVFNAGLHGHNLGKKEIHESILQALNDTGITGIYKTTSKSQQLNRTSRFSRGMHDKSLCGKVFRNCINLDWTGDLVGPQHYSDDVHFKSPGNTRMNLQLLDYVRDFNETGGGISQIDELEKYMNVSGNYSEEQ